MRVQTWFSTREFDSGLRGYQRVSNTGMIFHDHASNNDVIMISVVSFIKDSIYKIFLNYSFCIEHKTIFSKDKYIYLRIKL